MENHFNLKWMVVLSLAIHLGLLFFGLPQAMGTSRQVLDLIEVSYLPLQATPKQIAAVLNRPSALPRILPEGGSLPAASQTIQPAGRPVSESKSPAQTAESPEVVPFEPFTPLPKGSVTGLPEGEFASLEHKQMVRQHLKLHLNYPMVQAQGTVRLSVVLEPDGSLDEAAVLAASDPRLGGYAVEGARSAAPYPPFPKELKLTQARYEFLVQYSGD